MKIKIFALALIILLVFAGCVSITRPVAHDKGFPADGRYKILGPVSCEKKTIIILGLFWFGGIGYRDLYAAAIDKYKTQNLDVVNVSVDEEITSVFWVATRVDSIMRGTAITYTDTPE